MPREKTKGYTYLPKGFSITEEEDPDYMDFTNLVTADNTFHLGASLDEKAATTLTCQFCGSFEFNVGLGSYTTFIRCVKCKWEQPIHEG